MMMHLDLDVQELAEARRRAIALGAIVAECQPIRDVTVMLDLAGHPFCLSDQRAAVGRPVPQ
jgi:hypothetical protein